MTDQVVNQLITPVVVGFILVGLSLIAPWHIKRSGRKREEQAGGPRPGETSAKKAESPRATRFCLRRESLDI